MNIKITSLRLTFFSLILLAACNQLPQEVQQEAATELQPASGHSYNYVLKWGTQGSGDGQLNYPSDVAVDGSDNVYVADYNNLRIQRFNSSGTFITKWGTQGSGDGQFQMPYRVAVDGSGNVYVADHLNNHIQKFNSSGTFITKWGTQGSGDGQFRNPNGVAVDGSGNVYVTDANNHRIQKFNSSGTFITKWGTSGAGDGQLQYPSDVAVDGSGNVYVADYYNHRIQKFNSSGIFITKWGTQGAGDGQLGYPNGVAVDGSGNVYVADYYNHRIQKFAPSKDSQTITFNPLADKTFGNTPFEISATASSGLPVTLTSDTTGVCTVSGTTVTLVAAGTCTITASQAGNDDYAAATSGSQSFTVAKAAQNLTFADGTPTSAEQGTSATLEVTSNTETPIVLSAAPANVCSASGLEVSFLAVGDCAVTATQEGDANYNAGTASHTIKVVLTLTDTALSNVSGSGTYGGTATLTAKLMKAGGEALAGKTVAFSVAGIDVGNADTDESGVATLTGVSLTGKNAGDYPVAASFAGDNGAKLAASEGTGTLTVSKATQTLSFTSTAPENPKTGTTYSVSATATSRLAVVFSSTTESVCTVSGSTVSFENPGTCTIAAAQAGDDNYEAALQQTQSIIVVPADDTPPVIEPTVSGTLQPVAKEVKP